MRYLKLYDAHWSSLGGGEMYLCRLAEALSARHKVMLILDGPGRLELEERLGHRMDSVATCYGDQAHVDIILSNLWPYGNHPRAYVLQIPYGPITGATLGRKLLSNDLEGIGKDLLRKRLLRNARKSEIVLVYSRFVREVLMKHHGIDAEVLYPPVEDMASGTPKQKVILSVGRFFRSGYNVKRYDVLIEAFKLFHKEKPEWSYRIVGGAGPEADEYLTELQLQAMGYPITFHVNVKHGELRRHYGEATLLWHGAGYGARGPEDTESFGIAIVEGMSAGCVPFVHHSGGPVEIIGGYVSGYHWWGVRQLAELSMRLVADESTLEMFRYYTRKRFEDFTVAKFNARALEIFKPWEGK